MIIFKNFCEINYFRHEYIFGYILDIYMCDSSEALFCFSFHITIVYFNFLIGGFHLQPRSKNKALKKLNIRRYALQAKKQFDRINVVYVLIVIVSAELAACVDRVRCLFCNDESLSYDKG